MGWREALEDEFAATGSGWSGTRAERAMARILAMPAADRIALARELLPSGFVVGRDVPEEIIGLPHPEDYGRGWNACRAAMMENPDKPV